MCVSQASYVPEPQKIFVIAPAKELLSASMDNSLFYEGPGSIPNLSATWPILARCLLGQCIYCKKHASFLAEGNLWKVHTQNHGHSHGQGESLAPWPHWKKWVSCGEYWCSMASSEARGLHGILHGSPQGLNSQLLAWKDEATMDVTTWQELS